MSADNIATLIAPGESGDVSVQLRLTLREIAAVQYALYVASARGVFVIAYRHADAADSLGPHWAHAFECAQSRIGMATARVLGFDNDVDEFYGRMAELDRDRLDLGGTDGH